MNRSLRSSNYLIYIYGGLAVLLFSLGVIGFARYATWHNLSYRPLDWVYLTLQLIPMNSGAVEQPVPPELEVARFFIPLLAAIAAVQAFLRIFHEQFQMLRMPFLRGHIIICGLSHKGMLLAEKFRQQGRAVVMIEQDKENVWLESCRNQGMFVLVGDASNPHLLRSAGVMRAAVLIAVCDNDGVNTEIALCAQKLTQSRTGEPLTCLLHITDPQLCDLLREQEAGLELAPFRLELFNVFEHAARRMLQEFPAWDESLDNSNTLPHILIIGLGRMGENLTLHAARDWWNHQADHSKRMRITILDQYALSKVESLLIRYPQIGSSCELIPLQMDLRSPEFERAGFLFDNHGREHIHKIYICVDDDSLGLQAGLIFNHRMPNADIPIIVRMANENGLAKMLALQKKRPGTYRNLFAFGYLEQTCTPDLLYCSSRDLLARAAHEAYIQRLTGMGSTSLEDASLQPWDTLDRTFRKANYQWADHILLLLQAAGYHLSVLKEWDAPSMQFSHEQVEIMAKLEHELWLADRVADGWHYAAGVRDSHAKLHQDLDSWEVLPDEERNKNRLLVRGIPAFLGKAGLQVVVQHAPDS